MSAGAPLPFRTVRDLVRYGVSSLNQAGAFYGHGTQSAYDEAAYLVLHTLHLPLDMLEPFLDAALSEAEINSVLEVLERRARLRVPAAYLTQEAWLGAHRFYVDERVIVPRSFIAELLDTRLAPWIAAPDQVGRVLDMCTGSGCLAILAALAFPAAEVDAVDVSPDALAVARRNIADYGLGERVRPVQSDLFDALPATRYDLIISNPPYVDRASMMSLPKEYRAEPEIALAGGEDGLTVVRSLLRRSRAYLNPGGKLIVEIGHNRAALERAYPDTPFTWLSVAAGDDFVFMLDRELLA
ncbi:MAG: 50S ribosomal protein L3 N(5)-glutamine methyltransferase [Burkholderiales bacterium]|nr:50S ribosomal protein L3 N(5)-glutamine methyltransferase [Burkholderiales bacterium]